ncbi:hypothetical protein LXL04_025345 [Taraxacum kok-saghyz]
MAAEASSSSTVQTRENEKKEKMSWSKLYTFSCIRPQSNKSDLGQPGFSRVVFCNNPNRPAYTYPSNYVATTKYNLATFLPKCLFEQFRRVANMYFLLAAVLSLTSLTPFSPLSLIAPLLFVVGVSLMKEGVEDWRRRTTDREVNSRTVKVHTANGAPFTDRPWKALQVGDIIKVGKNEYFPADLLLLSSSYEDGLCYVETMNLDGETNLKIKRSLECTTGLDDEQKIEKFTATIRCEDPNPSLYTFVGNLDLGEEDGMISSYPLSASQILLRDSKLQNTDYVYGVVVFTGPDTKVIRNSMASPCKRSRVERRMDHVIYVLFVMLITISMITSIGSSRYTETTEGRWYLRLLDGRDGSFDPTTPLKSTVLLFLRALILYGYLIPVSLYVSIEVVKFIQALLINNDLELFDELTGKSVEARTSNLNEELGQVQMILSDKTGTLTCNRMEFKKCSIEGNSYGAGDIYEEVRGAYDQRVSCEEESGVEVAFEISSRTDTSVVDMTMFFRVMALCHTGIVVETEGSHTLQYEAESPEEVTFLAAAQEFGFQFWKRTQSSMFVRETDPHRSMVVQRQYELLNLLEFSSSRKRMSVIVRDDAGHILLLCKGADDIIFDRLGGGGRTHQHATTRHLSNYAEEGLRTMVFAYRRIEKAQYEEWASMSAIAKATIGPEREELLEKASEIIENDLVLVGAVAVEDRLQDGVPECIGKLAQAGLHIWLLTGDKKETAVNIGYSCSLLSHDMRLFHLSLSQDAESTKDLKAMKDEIADQIEAFHQEKVDGQVSKALVVDGKALEMALSNDVKDHFLRLAVDCASVICCRVSPKQKAMVTRLVKKYTGKITLAIGDGANDVGMIQAADIGVGISGVEGMQAVMASDFSMPQFRFLDRLLLVHGHWCYNRISKMILYSIYKNIVFGLTLFYFEVYSKFAGDVLYDGWYIVMFNLLLTSLPVISLGVLEQDVSSNNCLEFPALYKQGQKGIFFSWKQIIGWMGNAILTSLTIFILNIVMLSSSAFRHGGEVVDMYYLGVIMYTVVVWSVNCQIALIITHFTWIQHIIIWGSCLCLYLFLYVYAALPGIHTVREKLLVEVVGPAPMYWMTTLLVVFASLLPYVIYTVIQRSFYPTDDQLIVEMRHASNVDFNTGELHEEPVPEVLELELLESIPEHHP